MLASYFYAVDDEIAGSSECFAKAFLRKQQRILKELLKRVA